MKILFLTMTRFGDGTEHGIYTDLMRKFRDEGHAVYVVYPVDYDALAGACDVGLIFWITGLRFRTIRAGYCLI